MEGQTDNINWNNIVGQEAMQILERLKEYLSHS